MRKRSVHALARAMTTGSYLGSTPVAMTTASKPFNVSGVATVPNFTLTPVSVNCFWKYRKVS